MARSSLPTAATSRTCAPRWRCASRATRRARSRSGGWRRPAPPIPRAGPPGWSTRRPAQAAIATDRHARRCARPAGATAAASAARRRCAATSTVPGCSWRSRPSRAGPTSPAIPAPSCGRPRSPARCCGVRPTGRSRRSASCAAIDAPTSTSQQRAPASWPSSPPVPSRRSLWSRCAAVTAPRRPTAAASTCSPRRGSRSRATSAGRCVRRCCRHPPLLSRESLGTSRSASSTTRTPCASRRAARPPPARTGRFAPGARGSATAGGGWCAPRWGASTAM